MITLLQLLCFLHALSQLPFIITLPEKALLVINICLLHLSILKFLKSVAHIYTRER